MEFGIQMGYSLQATTLELTKRWGGGTAVVSPRAFRQQKTATVEQAIERYCSKLNKQSVHVYFDPMLYSSGAHIRSVAQTRYAKAATHAEKPGEMIKELVALNEACGTKALILPSKTYGECDSSWVQAQQNVLCCARRFAGSSVRLYLTIALTADCLKTDGVIDQIADAAESLPADGYYLTLEHPKNDYLTDEPLWLLNAMCLAASLKRLRKRVIIGYGSHQLLICALAKVDCLCGGNFLNVRRFSMQDFDMPVDDAPSRRATWYYVPQTLSEYKLPTLDLAYGSRILDKLRSPYDDEYASMLFAGALPSSTAYSERHSFRHYLYSLHEQCTQLPTASYAEVLYALRIMLATSDRLNEGLKELGIDDRARNFSRASQACSQAIAAFDSKMGFVMRRVWDQS